ncbi:MAG: hypothetical protein LBC63_09420 [Holophagales bacterium]|jgi:hypothetical protein|nr:hypothetical protein [Holophagales bacterium]
MLQVRVAGIPWFRRGDYDRARSICADGYSLPDAYDDWLKVAEEQRRLLESEGTNVVCGYIDSDWFPSWCHSKGMRVEYSSMRCFAEEVAAEVAICESERRLDKEYKKSLDEILADKQTVNNIFAMAIKHYREMLDSLNGELDEKDAKIGKLTAEIKALKGDSPKGFKSPRSSAKAATEYETVKVAALPWYKRDEYDRVRSVCTDGDSFAPTYDEWRKKTEEREKSAEGEGARVVTAHIDPDVFPGWCKSKGIKPNSDARELFAKEFATEIMTEYRELLEMLVDLKLPANANQGKVMYALERAAFNGRERGFERGREKGRGEARREKPREAENENAGAANNKAALFSLLGGRSNPLWAAVMKEDRANVAPLPWFSSEEYDRARSVCIDKDALPATYEEWQKEAEAQSKLAESKGLMVAWAAIDPDLFPQWCESNGIKPDSDARAKFAGEVADELMDEFQERLELLTAIGLPAGANMENVFDALGKAANNGRDRGYLKGYEKGYAVAR